MEFTCPKCGNAIETNDIKMSKDAIVCPTCNLTYCEFEAIALQQAYDINKPPKGAWFTKTPSGFVVGGTTRQLGIAILIVPFLLIVTTLLFGSVYGYDVPRGEYPLSTAVTVSAILFMVLWFWIDALMTVFGKVVVEISGEEGRAITGFGPVRWTRAFNWPNVTAVHQQPFNVTYPGCQKFVIVLEARKRVKFGSMLKDRQLSFMTLVLHKMLAERETSR